MPSSLAERFYQLFLGYEFAHGEYDPKYKNDRGKIEGKALTVRKPPTIALWEAHLAGTKGVGIIPLREDNTCHFGFIDIDIYDLDLKHVCKQFSAFPVVVFRSKSGGAHVGVFCKEPAPADLLHDKLSEWAASTGYGGVEIFPKQTVRAEGGNDIGNWINMPYFDMDKTTRYALNDKGQALKAAELFDYLDSTHRMLTVQQLASITVTVAQDGAFEDGPPCLQVLHGKGFPDGTRNMGLFDVGVYMRKAHPDDWQEKLNEYNVKYMDPPLKQAEVATVVKSLQRKTYSYRCKEAPICSFCDRKKCLKRKFGVGNGGAADDFTIRLGSLTKIDTRPPIWVVDLEGQRVEVDTDTLLSQRRFQVMCVEHIHRCPPPMNASRWAQRINELMANVEVIPAPDDASEGGQFMAMVENFLADTSLSKEPSDLIRGRPVQDAKEARIYFRAQDLIKYLENRRFRGDIRPNRIWSALRNIGAMKRQFNVNGKCVQAWGIPEVPAYDDTALPLPTMPEDASGTAA